MINNDFYYIFFTFYIKFAYFLFLSNWIGHKFGRLGFDSDVVNKNVYNMRIRADTGLNV